MKAMRKAERERDAEWAQEVFDEAIARSLDRTTVVRITLRNPRAANAKSKLSYQSFVKRIKPDHLRRD